MVFEKYNSNARGVVVQSQEEARRFRSAYIGTEHLLLALLQPNRVVGQDLAFDALTSLGVRYEKANEVIKSIIGVGAENPITHIPFSVNAKNVVGIYCLKVSEHLGVNYIGVEHLLFALLKHTDCTAVQCLNELGIKPDDVRRAVLKLMSERNMPLPAGLDSIVSPTKFHVSLNIDGRVIYVDENMESVLRRAVSSNNSLSLAQLLRAVSESL